MTVKEFMNTHNGGYNVSRNGKRVYNNTDDMIVIDWMYQPLNGIYTLFVA